MNENKFKIRRLAKWREESEEMFREIGLRPCQYMELLGSLADVGTEKIIAQGSQFLFDFSENGSTALGERYGKTDRTMRYWRHDILQYRALVLIGKKEAA